MANYLRVAMIESICRLHGRGWSQRRIARDLGVDRETVSRYLRENPPKVPAGSGENPPGVPTGSGEGPEAENPPRVPTGFARSQSLCLAHAAVIEAALEQGLSAQRIWQDLVAEHGFAGGYDSVKRYVRQLREASPEPFRRLESPPGEQAQIDFGQGGWVIGEDGKRRRPHLFRIVLSHSRKAYSEVVWRQDTESVIRVLENAFRRFGGVTKTLVPDNMKCAVLRAEWADPDLNPKLRDFCRHYGTVLLPAKVRMARHKGKVEAGVKYAQNNAVKGRTFGSLAEQNAYLQSWERKVSDTRIHGTTRQQVQAAFTAERPHLLPLPDTLFPCFEEGLRTVHRDGHVEVAKSYYSVPPEYVRRQVWVRYDLRTVRIYNARSFSQVRLHPRVEPGRFQTDPHDIPPRKLAAIERGEHQLLRDLQFAGDDVHAWAKAMLQARGIEGVRVLVGLRSLVSKQPTSRLNEACREARKRHRWRLRELRQLLHEPPGCQPDLLLQQAHPIIRDLGAYQALVGPFH